MFCSNACKQLAAARHMRAVRLSRGPRDPSELFWRKVDRLGPTSQHCPELGPCWIWTAGRNALGYGSFKFGPRRGQLAHRVSWELAHGAPGQLHVLHRCDNPPCVNPAHLFLGTHQDNMDDMYAKGRRVPARGERNRHAKLTVEQVQEIRDRYAGGEIQISLAKAFGVSQPAISQIVRRAHWRV